MSDLAKAKYNGVPRYINLIRPDTTTKEEYQAKSEKIKSSLTSKINKGRGENNK